MNRSDREDDFQTIWYNESKHSHHPSDQIDEPLLPTNTPHKQSHRSSNMRICHWIRAHKLLLLLIIFVCIPALLYLFLLILSANRAFIPEEFQQNHHHRLLLIVAHPDDECLFFAPTLRILQTQYHVNLSLLVLSRGNHVGLGDVRARELHGSCQALHIPKDRCLSLDLPELQDNPKVWWPEQQLISIINEYIHSWSIDLLVSFDNKGVSGHINHRAIASAVHLYIQKQNNTVIKTAYELKSVSILRKYSSVLDFYVVFLSFLPRLVHSLVSYLVPFNLISSPDSSRVLLINTPHDYMASRAAFASHRTQYSWDRYIYLMASRYMFMNELKSIRKNL